MADEWIDAQVNEADGNASSAMWEDQFLVRFTSQAPWWLVSVVFHILIIVLAYMFSIAVTDLGEDMIPVVSTAHIPPHPFDAIEDKKPKPESISALVSKNEIIATDKMASEFSKVEVSRELLLSAVLGDHYETDNPHLPNSHSAIGDPEAKLIHNPHGDISKPGGGGNHGTSQLEEMIGSAGAQNKGTGGGSFGGNGTGRGLNDGTKTGSFGIHRNKGGRLAMVKRFQGSAQTENAVEAALRWLSYHQESDGHWDAKKYGSSEKTDTAVTALSLLAFLGTGHTEKIGDYKDNVRRAVSWLKSKQAASGLIFDTTDAGGHRGEGYPGAMASMAIAEAAAMANIPDTRDAAQRAVTYCTETHQAGEGSDKLGWRYRPKSESDTSVTGWFMMALKSANFAKLKVNHAAFDGAIRYLDSVEHKAPGGDPGYAPASTYWYTVKDAHEPHRLTAIGCLCRQYLGWKKEELQASVDGFVATGGVPTWGGNGGGVDLYYWYYGSLCTFQQGGDVWKRWNEGLKSALVPNQRKDGDDAGSWDPVGAYATEWGRVGETALGCLCLEVYYRYGLLNPSEMK